MARTCPYSVCRLRVLLIGETGLSVYIVSQTQAFKAIVPMSRKYQPTRAVWSSSLAMRNLSHLRY
jgi:uncharacterized protein YfbU (UPF0304 family)